VTRCWRKRRCSLRSDALYLTDIAEAAEAVAEFIAGLKRETFVGNKMARSGNLVFVSGQLPTKDGALMARGHVSAEVPLEDA